MSETVHRITSPEWYKTPATEYEWTVCDICGNPVPEPNTEITANAQVACDFPDGTGCYNDLPEEEKR